jgi:hypothetical protein
MRGSILVSAAAVIAGLLAASCSALTDRGYEPKYVSRATAQDCAVITVVAKAMVGPDARDFPIKPGHQLADGGEFKEACAWKSLGVLNPSAPKSGEQSFVIYKPSFQADAAEVTVDIIGPPQKGARPRITGYATCQVKRTGSAWAVQRCARR